MRTTDLWQGKLWISSVALLWACSAQEPGVPAENASGIGVPPAPADSTKDAAGGVVSVADAGSAPMPGAVGGGFAGEVQLNLVPEHATQDAVKKKGDYVNISGTLAGDMCQGKTIRVEALGASAASPGPSSILTTKGIGSFSMVVPKGTDKVWLTGLCDVNDDGLIQDGVDAYAAYKGNPVNPSAAVTGVSMTFSLKRPGTSDGMPPADPSMGGVAPSPADAPAVAASPVP